MNHLDKRFSGSRPLNRGDILGVVTDAVRDNPMSAALIGMGALWLFMGGSNKSLLGGNGRSSILSSVADGAGTVAHGAAGAASRMGSNVASMGSSIASTVSSTASGVASSVSDAAGRAGEYVSGGLRGVDAHAEYRNPVIPDDIREETSKIASPAGLEEEDDTSSFVSFRGSLQELFERHPMALGVAGIALGAGIAASLPLTSTERDTLSKVGEAARSKAGELADQAKDMASAAVDEVRQQGSGGGFQS